MAKFMIKQNYHAHRARANNSFAQGSHSTTVPYGTLVQYCWHDHIITHISPHYHTSYPTAVRTRPAKLKTTTLQKKEERIEQSTSKYKSEFLLVIAGERTILRLYARVASVSHKQAYF